MIGQNDPFCLMPRHPLRNGAASSLFPTPYFGQNGQGTDRLAAVQVELPFERQLYRRTKRRVVAESTISSAFRKAAGPFLANNQTPWLLIGI